MKIPPVPNPDKRPPPLKAVILQCYAERFDALYPTERERFEELLKRYSDDDATKCNACGSLDLERGNNYRVRKCKVCKKLIWLSAGTFFAHIRSARPWLLAIKMKEDGVDFNAGDLHRLGYIAASTALEILKKLNTVIFSEMEAESNAIDVYSGQFAPIVCKRSLETPANEHPTTEQDELEKRLLSKDQGAFAPGSSQSSGGTHSRRAAVNALSGPQLAVYELLSTDPIDFETLREKTNMPIGPLSATLSLLELEELVERLTGDKYVCSTGGAAASRKAWAMQSSNGEDAAIYGTEMISSSINFVRSGFHGVSRKYLQLYLAAHWCHVDRARWSSNKLLKACRRFREVKPAEIRAFVSPLFMKVMPCASLT